MEGRGGEHPRTRHQPRHHRIGLADEQRGDRRAVVGRGGVLARGDEGLATQVRAHQRRMCRVDRGVDDADRLAAPARATVRRPADQFARSTARPLAARCGSGLGDLVQVVQIELAGSALGQDLARAAGVQARRQAQAGEAHAELARLHALDHAQAEGGGAVQGRLTRREQQEFVGDEGLAGDRQGIFQRLVVGRRLAPAAATIPPARTAAPSTIATAVSITPVAVVRMGADAGEAEAVPQWQIGKCGGMKRQQQRERACTATQRGAEAAGRDEGHREIHRCFDLEDFGACTCGSAGCDAHALCRRRSEWAHDEPVPPRC